MQVFILGALQRSPPLKSMPDDKKVKPPISKSKTAHSKASEQSYNDSNKSEVIWTSETSGTAALSVTSDQQVELDLISGDVDHTHEEGNDNSPSYVGLLKRPQVLRVIIIIACGIAGSRGKLYSNSHFSILHHRLKTIQLLRPFKSINKRKYPTPL